MSSVDRKSVTEKAALIEDYEGFDEYEGDYTYYECGNCGEYLTDSLAMTFRGEKMPKRCPRCGAQLRRWTHER